MEVFKSATKITLLLIVLTVVLTTTGVVFYNLAEWDVVKTVLSVFANAVALVLWFYFWQKVSLNNSNSSNGI